jgi:hypothetical protein
MKTAVEWLVNTLGYNENMGGGVKEIIEIAKKMEKEQIIEAYCNGDDNISADQYYNETFNKSINNKG